jgi:hypothetical protein
MWGWNIVDPGEHTRAQRESTGVDSHQRGWLPHGGSVVVFSPCLIMLVGPMKPPEVRAANGAWFITTGWRFPAHLHSDK